MKPEILLVEDDQNLGFITKDNLELKNFKVTWAKNGVDGLDEFCKNKFDLCILDVMLPLKDGFELAADIRKKDSSTPILFLTAKSLDEDKIKAFKLGGDDFVSKPFNIEILILRIQALLKRANRLPLNKEIVKIGRLTFDPNASMIYGENYQQSLTKKEVLILNLLCSHKNQVLKRDYALKLIWGEDDYFKGRSMDVFITKLRKYLSEDPAIEIQNLHGIGFKLVDK